MFSKNRKNTLWSSALGDKTVASGACLWGPVIPESALSSHLKELEWQDNPQQGTCSYSHGRNINLKKNKILKQCFFTLSTAHIAVHTSLTFVRLSQVATACFIYAVVEVTIYKQCSYFR